MNRKKFIGIIFTLVALFLAVIFIKKVAFRENEEITTDSKEVTKFATAEEISSFATKEEAAATVVTMENDVTENREDVTKSQLQEYKEQEFESWEQMKVRLPDQESLDMADGDKEGLKKAVQTFANGYGYLNAKYAEYSGEMAIDSNNHTVTYTYYFKFKGNKVEYFKVIYNTKTKEWSTQLV